MGMKKKIVDTEFLDKLDAEMKLSQEHERVFPVYSRDEHLPSLPQKPSQFTRDKKKIGRNESCPCGSGKKHKKCCINNQK